jgi:branched-chain amino acid transport system permease protein
MLLILIFRKAGIMGGKELRWPWSVRDDGTVVGVGQVRLARSADCHR